MSLELLKKGFELFIYDPKIKKSRIISDIIQLNNLNNKDQIKTINKIKVFDDLKSAVILEYPLVILTEWDEFKTLNNSNKKLKIFDFRNIIDRDKTIFSL